MSIATVRTLTNDNYLAAEEQFIGDGQTLTYLLGVRTIKSESETVMVGGDAKTRTTHYTIDNATGRIDFVTAQRPDDGEIVKVVFQHSILSDDDITAILALDEVSSDPVLGAAFALDVIASHQALVLKVIQIQGLKTDGAKVAASLRAHAKELRESSGGDFDWAEMVVDQFTFSERIWNENQRET